jgi:hypothetical protein
MQKMAKLVGKELKWSQPTARKKEFVLNADNLLAATLRYRSSLGSFAVAESGDGSWTFKRVGFFKSHVVVRPSDDDLRDIATFHNKTWKGGGTLQVVSGATLRANTNFWQTKFSFMSASDEPLVVFNTSGIVHYSATVEIQPQAATMPELPLMVILGWYLAIGMKDDASSAAASMAAAG